MRRAVILFTRAPIPGHTKTRLMPAVSPKGCARLHTCFLEDIWRECKKTGADLFVCYTPKGQEKRLYPVFGTGADVRYLPQRGDGLGERMYLAFCEVFKKGYHACLLMGTDVPEVRERDLNRAFAILNGKDIVLGPTKDGGYYLVGMKRPVKCIFQVEGYGKTSVLRDTVRQAKRAGLTVGFTEALWDMDTYEDLQGYRRRMRDEKKPREVGVWRFGPRIWPAYGRRNTVTGKYLERTAKISIIIPTYNEEKTISKMQDQLEPLRERCEILFVDGGSTDGTLERIRPHFQVLHSEKGRAIQMNTGARASHGDILFFLHCDSELPPRPLEEIRRVMKTHYAGCFGIAFHSRSFLMSVCRLISNHRVKDRKVMFGDQGIFVDRDLFFDVGMFREIPIMEDYQFSLTLKERKIRLGMARRRICTSARRFPKGTIPKLKLMWKMNRLRKMYRDGVPIERIDRLYRDVR